MEDTFKDAIIDEGQHNKSLNQHFLVEWKSIENFILKSVVRMEKLYVLQDKFKKPTNYKTNNSSMQYEVVNLGFVANPQNINLGINYTLEERDAFIKLLKEYNDVFA